MQRKQPIRNTSDIIKLQFYVSKFDVTTTPIIRIVDSYDIRPSSIRCSLCGKEHHDGRIVELRGGSVSNIGHICGKRYGGKGYGDALDAYLSAMNLPQLKARIREGGHKLESFRVQIGALHDSCLELRRYIQSFQSRFPDTFRELQRMAMENRPEVFESVERTDAQIADLMAANPRQNREALKYGRVSIGAISGYRFAATDWDPTHGLMKFFNEVSEFEKFQGSDLGKMRRWANWVDDLEENMQRLGAVVQDGFRFFSSGNFRLFAHLPAPLALRRQLETLTIGDLRMSDSGNTKVKPQSVLPVGIQRARKAKPTATARELRNLTGDKKMRW
ncbi:hypothetical protein ACTOWA_20805 [Herbaspirillum seropedicae]|uniref:hypothetical protein n=1 Tax=Herbaspirillum seropedicae TaxID=964 RepID=UPI003F8D3609